MSKLCTRCKDHKSLDSFHKDRKTKSGLSGWCKECSKAYRLANKEHIAARGKAYNAKNRDKIKQYCLDNKDRMRETIAVWREANKEKVLQDCRRDYHNRDEAAKERYRAYVREYHKENRDKVKAKNKEYRQSDRGKLSAINRHNKRKAIKRATADNTVPMGYIYPLNKDLQELLDKQDNKCHLCSTHISREKQNIELDHWVPLSKGGTHTIDNVVWLCKECNRSKFNKVPDQLLLIIKEQS